MSLSEFDTSEPMAALDEPDLPSFARLSTAELLASPRPGYLIDGVLVDGQPAVLGGSFKAMKTSVACDLAVSLAAGIPFLGYFPVQRAVRVGVMSGESGPHTLAETTSRVAVAGGIDPRQALQNLVWSTRVPQLTSSAHLCALRSFIEADGLRVLVIDPLYMAIPGASSDASNLFAMGKVFRPLADLGQETGCTIVLVHHTSRGASRQRGNGPPELSDLAFSGTAEFARQWILLGRRSQFRPGTGFHDMWLVTGGSAGHSGLFAVDIHEGTQNATEGRKWDVTVSASDKHDERQTQQRENAAAERLERKEAEYASRIFAILTRYPDGATGKALREESNVNSNAFRTAIKRLLSEGKALACTIEKNKRSYGGYKPHSEPVNAPPAVNGTDRD